PRPRAACLLEALLELCHVVVGIAVALRLAETDAVDDAGVIERIGNDGITLIEQRLEETAVGIEAGGVEDGILGAEETAEALLELLVHGLRAADEAHGGHAEAEPVEGPVRRLPYGRMIGEAEVVVGAEVHHLPLPGPHRASLRSCEHALALVKALFPKSCEIGA